MHIIIVDLFNISDVSTKDIRDILEFGKFVPAFC